MNKHQRETEIERLNRMLESSESMGAGYKTRIAAIKTRIAELEREANPS